MPFIQADHLEKRYVSGRGEAMAVRDASLSIERGEFAAIMGESGSGKSTLLTMMGALNTPTAGRLLVDGTDVYRLTGNARADFRRAHVGFVFQSFFLVPYLTVAENVMLPLAIEKGLKNREKRAQAERALDSMGILGKADSLPSEISGGEQERTALARAVVNRPTILLADEPTGNLDTRTTDTVMRLFEDLNREGMTIVMVTHSQRCADHARRTLYMADGRLLSGGFKKPAGEVRTHRRTGEQRRSGLAACPK